MFVIRERFYAHPVLLGKFHPRTGHAVPEGEEKYSSIIYLISALDGDGWLSRRPGRFTPGKEIRRSFYMAVDGPRAVLDE